MDLEEIYIPQWKLRFLGGILFYSLFIFNNLYKTAVNAAPEKLTPEEVLEELGVKIETKGKTNKFSNNFFIMSNIYDSY